MFKQSPIVSIVVPVFNVENFLADCIGSVLSQSFLEWELLLVNDGSTDKSGKLCDKYATRDSRIHVIHQANSGPSVARNHGIDIAKGEYLLFLDSDDKWLHNDLLKLLMEKTTSQANDLLLFNYCRISEIAESAKPNIRFPKKTPNTNEALLNCLVQNNAFQSSACTKLVRRSLVGTLRFEVGVRGEDIEWTAELLKKNQNIGFLDVLGYGYRINKTSATQNISESLVANSATIVERLLQASDICPEKKRKAYLGYCAFQYCTLVLNMNLLPENLPQELREKIQEMASVLQYGMCREVRLIRLFHTIVGFDTMSALLTWYFKRAK